MTARAIELRQFTHDLARSEKLKKLESLAAAGWGQGEPSLDCKPASST
jgi:hypothetical protein